MEFNKIINEVVRAAFIALQTKDRPGFQQLLKQGAVLIHNGETEDITAWSDQFFFGKYRAVFTSIVKTADEGLTVYAALDSELAGTVSVVMRFTLEAGKIIQLNAGRPETEKLTKTALVTGASTGIGLALTKKLLQEGYRVFGGSRSGQINGVEDDQLEVIVLDITDENSVDAALKTVVAKAGKIDLLINNAGIGSDVMRQIPEYHSFRQTLDTNVTGTVFFTEKMISLVHDGGEIIFISSDMALIRNLQPNAPAYRISKAAVNVYAIMLAERLKERHIRVTPVHPGWVQTRMGGEQASFSPEQSAGLIFKGLIDGSPSGKFYNAALSAVEEY